jgi:carbonic anhydrase/acetyltransferase-like protein (isoleucine patch superfamily)
VLTGEDGEVRVGSESVVLEHAVIRGRAGHPAVIGSHVMVGPHAHVNGATVGDRAFIATGASLFPGASIGEGAEVRVNGVVQVNTTLEPGAVVPIGWVAVGTPARIVSLDRHEEIWAVQRTLDFPGTVYGVDRSAGMAEIMRRQSAFYAAHDDDRVVD